MKRAVSLLKNKGTAHFFCPQTPRMNRSFLLRSLPMLALLLVSQNLMAQQTVEMADQLRADGKIWVVVAVIATVFFGIILYLVSLDRKIGKLEREVGDQKPQPSQRPMSKI
jgi:CcmD family protein